jgi:hypothetical protein
MSKYTVARMIEPLSGPSGPTWVVDVDAGVKPEPEWNLSVGLTAFDQAGWKLVAVTSVVVEGPGVRHNLFLFHP